MSPTRAGRRQARIDRDHHSQGALIAVPILTCIKVISDTVDRLAPIGQFLGGRRLK